MKPRRIFICCLILTMLGWSLPSASSALGKDTIRRFAIVIGANDGGRERPKLRYAVSDAKSMIHLLQKIGGVFPIDCVFLVDPDRTALLSGIKRLQKKIQAAQSSAKKIEMIFYYSGHSDEEAILLGRERVSYKEIKKSIEHIPADVRIAILDSCSSGAFTRLKGGKKRPPFLIDSSNDMKGFAFLTSSASDEASQESDRLKSSFFTHFLLSGLRGAADMTQDGRVTLNEAYQYAYHETLVKTEKTLGGPQHPNYNIQMTGTGDVVMTDIRNSSAIMSLDKDLHGRIFIRDMQDHVVLEMRKPAGQSMHIGLEAGTYLISNERNQGLYEARIELTLGQELQLTQSLFTEVKREHTVARGSSQPEDRDIGDAIVRSYPLGKFSDPGYQVVPWDFNLIPNGDVYGKTIHYYVFGLAGSYSAKLDGFALALGPNIVKENARGGMFSGLGNFVGADSEGAQFAGVFNICKGNYNGAQSAGIMSISNGSLSGVQYAGILSISRRSVSGAQFGGILAMSGRDLTGAQFGGIFTMAKGNALGVQNAGIFAIVDGDLTGAQASGIFNYTAGHLEGVQLSLVNISGDCDGAQFGLINLAKEQRGLPVGLVNLSENGSVDLVAWKDNLTAANLGVKFRSGYFYSIFSTSKRTFLTKAADGWGFGFYYGTHIPLRPFYIEADLGYAIVNNEPTHEYDVNDQQSAQGRIKFGVKFRDRFSLFVGAGAAYVYRGKFESVNHDLNGTLVRKDEWKLVEERWEPLYLAGASLSF